MVVQGRGGLMPKEKPKNNVVALRKVPLPALEDMAALWRLMLLIRRFEEKAGHLYGMGNIGGFCHLYIGQEAVVAGISSAQAPQDTVVTSYRDHAHMLACGMPPGEIMAELTGRATGSSRGKGGSMHMFSRDHRFYGGHGIVGASTSIGTGLAFAHKYRGDGGVAVAYMGDGAANQGQVAECYNMAALWGLPVLYVIENNKYAMGTSVNRGVAGELYKRGEGYGIPGAQVDGMDVLDVRAAAAQALAHVRGAGGPFILEVMTYRYRGHSMSDPAQYRSKEEVKTYRTERDPIAALKARMLAAGAEEEAFKAVEREIKEIIAAAAQFALDSPEPEEGELWTDVVVGE
mgnify:CR=1 FL=1